MSKAIIAKKQELTEELTTKLKNAKSFLVFQYLGLTVKELTNIRKKLHEKNASIHIVKNNILNRALKNSDFGLDECTGPNAVIISNGDEVIPFNLVSKLMKDHTFIKFNGGCLEGNKIAANDFASVANLASRNDLYSMLLSCLTAPIRNFLYGLNSISKQKN